ncbi:hypothetical protein C8A03DRAFT_39567 [Achaetomium macrosporum]|uniref:2EXR domain-containing protein n=1 Tax=Achaetomium macrosporum TaxID=79813 RepID=A0AAN7C024_9PEZI|nr:hypothetical protein C8A03DRAFT_39567 [Achaetomium macrosporum]
MDQTPAPTQTDTTILVEETPVSTPPRLFNDVHLGRWEPPVPRSTTWTPFSRLPAELRLHVWLACLRRHRMIEIDICPAAEEDATTYPGDGSQSRYYTDRNGLGNVVSGRSYVLSWSGRRRRGHAGSYSPLLWVNHESRRATLEFYRVHLPFFGLQREGVLYLNPAYDVVSIRSRWDESRTTPHPNPLTLLADFLHDVKAYDPKEQGVAHLVLNEGFHSVDLIEVAGSQTLASCFQLTPADLHPAAAASFTDILQRRLRSVLFAIRFRTCYRGLGEFPPGRGLKYHFAQTIPLARRDHPAGAFHWLEADPRPGVEIDIQQLPLGEDPRMLARDWKQLEQVFGVTRPTEHQHQHQEQAARDDKAQTTGPRLYVCPRIRWPKYEREELLQQNRNRTATPPQEEEEQEKEEEWPWRAELARHLREEAKDWLHSRMWFHEAVRGAFPHWSIPRHGDVLDAETFQRMERLPCLAIGMWLFPAEAFDKEPTNPRRFCFDVSPVRPGLFLFEL